MNYRKNSVKMRLKSYNYMLKPVKNILKLQIWRTTAIYVHGL